MFTEDNRTEAFLRRFGAKFTFEQLSYDDLSPMWNVVNLGRERPLDDDAIEEYALRMEQGSAAPAVITVRRRKVEVLDGVQRLMAGQLCGATMFSSYVLPSRTNPKLQRMLRMGATGHVCGSHSPDPKYMLHLAVKHLVTMPDDKCSAEEVAKCLCRKKSDVEREIKFQVTTSHFPEINFDPSVHKLRKALVAEVGRCVDATDWALAPGPIREFLECVSACKFRATEEGEPYIQEFFDIKRTAKKDRAAQFGSRLKEFKSKPEIAYRLRKKGERDPLDQLLQAMRGISTTLEKIRAKKTKIDTDDYARNIAHELRKIVQGVSDITAHEIEFPKAGAGSIYRP